MNFNTNFRHDCCRCPHNCNQNNTWTNPHFCPQMPCCRPCEKPCNRPCWNQPDCCNNWNREFDKRDNFEDNFFQDEMNYQKDDRYEYYPQEIGNNNNYERREEFSKEKEHDRKPCDCEKREKHDCNHNRNCNNFCIPRNACCFLAGCLFGNCSKCRCR